MHDNRTHPLLQQLPLTVSPFVNLPTATTLPYTYKPMPSALPASSIGITAAPPTATTATTTTNPTDSNTPPAGSGAERKPRYVVSASGHAAHPDDILASCRELHAHVSKLQSDAEAELARVEERIRARELAEKRRVAPGWLDSEARLLEPERKAPAGPAGAAAAEQGGTGHEMQQRGFGAEDAGGTSGGGGHGHGPGGASEMAVPDEGRELDRFFGGLSIRPK
ncbi:hypothetical protein MMYC01_206275 [Madurella mycetomatis]|uniref:Uncharacterized protein n=1 Tax=Madurella mycetomatis TaxID=100816 RepID=A0A175W0N4_9PEZI|nr:hypothetical protein MMYC01_206635 [Madurella mycetomatis]KXX78973.1 hypothetical protein MMYC01_206275 [Madurella mycetomatis]